MLDLEEVIADRMHQRQSVDWQIACAELRCGEVLCLDHPCKVEAVPYGSNNPALRQRRAQLMLINLALSVLVDASRQSKLESVGTPAVRLALRVLYPHVDDRDMLVEFWRQATSTEVHPWSGARQALRWIIRRLLDRGYSVWAEFR